ncbi:MAG: hypothetical protein E4G94_03055 [ANME-2 cluster archaeon]|nr:MAG: hypothetical protein E4G94_03055 [ANME-2 cluster archaeon]
MKKILGLVLLFAVLTFSIISVSAASVERLPTKIASGTEINVPQQAIDAVSKNRLIVPTTSAIDKRLFKAKGCKITQELNDATALECPAGITIKNARPDRIFYVNDLNADIQINADDVWNSDPGFDGSGITIAILDTGVDATHYELTDSVLLTKNFVGGSNLDSDGHGTHVSGIVTSDGDFTYGGAGNTKGVAPGSDIIVGKVCGLFGCRESSIMKGIEWAVAEGADVISMSLAGGNYYGSDCDGDPLAAKVNWAVEQGVVTVVAAGNDGAGVSSPACASGAIAVGAVDSNDVKASWSNYGSALDIVAPGVDIFSTYSCVAANNCGIYYNAAWMSGTSMATPHVAGVAALILQKHPLYTVDDVKEALYKSAFDLGSIGWDEYYGYGRVDALTAVNYEIAPSDLAPVVNILNPADGATVSGTTTIEVEASDDGGIISVDYSIDGGSSSPMTQNLSTGNYEATWGTTLVSESSHTIEVIATDTIGQEASDTNGVIVDNDASPSVTISNPGNGATVSGSITITTVPIDDSGIDKVDFYIDDALLAETTDPYQTTWDTITIPDGSHTIKAIATDTIGQTASDTITVIVDNVVDTNSMHVSNISMWYSKKGKNYFINTRVTIKDSGANPVPEATINLDTELLSDGSTVYASGLTGIDGTVLFKLKTGDTGIFNSTVTNVDKIGGWTYDPSNNVETSKEITVP